MKLIVQIPRYNEEQTLPRVLADTPRKIERIDIVEILVIDDGSADKTEEVSRSNGVEHLAKNKKPRIGAVLLERFIHRASGRC